MIYKNRLTTCLFLCLHFFLGAQQVCSFSVYFESNSNKLSAAAVAKIDSAVKALSNIPKAYLINVDGHTDNSGSKALNNSLSLRRAEETTAYLLSKGFTKKSSSSKGFADTQPKESNELENGKALNRRAVVTISAREFSLAKLLNIRNNTQSYTVNTEKEEKLSYASGTTLTIPAGAFLDMQGNKVKGSVELRYTEYRDNADFLLSGIPMSFFNEQGELQRFNSGGMLKVEAFQNGKQLQLDPSKNIGINFSKSQDLPDLNFFSYDSIHSKWNQAGSLNKNQKTNKVNYILGHGWHGYISCVAKIKGKDSCILVYPVGTLFALRKGAELASGKDPLLYKQAIAYFSDKGKVAGARVETYSMKLVSSSKKKKEFTIVPLTDSTVYDNYKSYTWIYRVNKKQNFLAAWTKKTWLKVSVNYLGNNDFELRLTSNSESITLPVAAKPMNGLSKSEMIALHEKNRDNNWVKVVEKYDEETEFKNDVQKEALLDSTWFDDLDKAGHDSLFCFYQYNRQWMSKQNGEDTLSYRNWLDYFNENKTLMLQRYETIKKDTAFVNGLKREVWKIEEAERKARAEWQEKEAERQQQYNQLDDVFEVLSINNLGIWNCDQVERLIEPIYVKKTYRNDEGSKVEPVVIYVVDKKVSGTLTYNGYGNMSPYNFPVSSKSENTLIAFDDDNRPYICSAALLSKCIREKGPIVLTPMRNLKSKDDLALLLN